MFDLTPKDVPLNHFMYFLLPVEQNFGVDDVMHFNCTISDLDYSWAENSYIYYLDENIAVFLSKAKRVQQLQLVYNPKMAILAQ